MAGWPDSDMPGLEVADQRAAGNSPINQHAYDPDLFNPIRCIMPLCL